MNVKSLLYKVSYNINFTQFVAKVQTFIEGL